MIVGGVEGDVVFGDGDGEGDGDVVGWSVLRAGTELGTFVLTVELSVVPLFTAATDEVEPWGGTGRAGAGPLIGAA
jgi:hypothetical protein